MKAITIWQPFTSLIAQGAKRFETRSWRTLHRGTIAIHSGKRPYPLIDGYYGDKFLTALADGLRVHRKYDTETEGEFLRRTLNDLPYGAIIAVAVLKDCYQIYNNALVGHSHNYPSQRQAVSEPESLFGDFTAGRFAWELANVRVLKTPIPISGRQQLWGVPPEAEQQINNQLEESTND